MKFRGMKEIMRDVWLTFAAGVGRKSSTYRNNGLLRCYSISSNFGTYCSLRSSSRCITLKSRGVLGLTQLVAQFRLIILRLAISTLPNQSISPRTPSDCQISPPTIAMEESNFKHSPLSRDEDEIRLVDLLPCTDSTASIRCNIQHVKLSDRPQYEALSYVWGSVDEPKSIEIDGKKQSIRENLYLALKRLRLVAKPRSLWIDAICINQNNVSERNHQVEQMGKIYKQAKQVDIWLGPGNDDNQVAIEFLKRLAHDPIPSWDYGKFIFKPGWQSLVRLCQMEYWGRLWIIQEVALAHKMILYCGRGTIDWKSFNTVLYELKERERFHTHRYQELHDIYSTIPGRFSQRRFNAKSDDPEALPVLDLFITFKDSLCQDPRDKIYGLLSLARDCCKREIVVDYSNTPFEVCRVALEHHRCHQDTMNEAEIMEFNYLIHSLLGKSVHLQDLREAISATGEDGSTGVCVGSIIYTNPWSDSPTTSPFNNKRFGRDISILPPYNLYFNRTYWKRSLSLSGVNQLPGVLILLPAYSSNDSPAMLLGYPDVVRMLPASYLTSRYLHKATEMLIDRAKHIGASSQPSQLKIFLTDNGLIGLSSGDVETGDIVYLSDNANTAFIVRGTSLQEFVQVSGQPTQQEWVYRG